MNARHYAIAALVLVGTVVLPGCGVGEASLSATSGLPEAAPVPVEVALPRRADVFATYRATSALESDADAPVLARVSGEVVELLAEEGQHVRAGQALARLDGERLRLEMLEALAQVDQRRGELQRYTDLAERGLVSEAMYEGLRYDVAALQATYERKKLNYEYSTIRAPISGIVSSRDIKLGQNVTAGGVTFRVTDDRELRADLQVPQGEIRKFAAGLDAEVSVDSSPGGRFPATIARISPTIDKHNGTFRATVQVQNRNGALVPGMFARFTVAYEKHENALLVPETAVVREDDETVVYVVTDGELERRGVQTGIAADGHVEVLSGLGDDEEVVVLGHSGLREGSKVLASRSNQDGLTG